MQPAISLVFFTALIMTAAPAFANCNEKAALEADTACSYGVAAQVAVAECNDAIPLVKACVMTAQTPQDKGRWNFLLGENYKDAYDLYVFDFDRRTQRARLAIAAYKRALQYPLPQHKIDDSNSAIERLASELRAQAEASDR